jgi:hypothetical protein
MIILSIETMLSIKTMTITVKVTIKITNLIIIIIIIIINIIIMITTNIHKINCTINIQNNAITQ